MALRLFLNRFHFVLSHNYLWWPQDSNGHICIVSTSGVGVCSRSRQCSRFHQLCSHVFNRRFKLHKEYLPTDSAAGITLLLLIWLAEISPLQTDGSSKHVLFESSCPFSKQLPAPQTTFCSGVTPLPVTQIKSVEKNYLFLKEICSTQPSPV